MRGNVRVCLALALLAATAAAGDDALSQLERQQQALFEKIAPAVVFIARGGTFGSGFFVSSEGLILTNAHVVERAQKVDVVLSDGRKLAGEVVERGANDLDVALVRVPLKDAPALALGGVDSVKVGSWVGAVGHGRGAIWTFNSGMISNIYPAGAERPVFQTQIPLNPGNSGGPIFDRQGRVVGIVTAGIEGSNAINFGIDGEVAVRSLSKLAGLRDFLVINAPAGVPVFVDGSMVGKGPRVTVAAARGKSYAVFAVVEGKMKKAQVVFPDSREVTLP